MSSEKAEAVCECGNLILKPSYCIWNTGGFISISEWKTSNLDGTIS